MNQGFLMNQISSFFQIQINKILPELTRIKLNQIKP